MSTYSGVVVDNRECNQNVGYESLGELADSCGEAIAIVRCDAVDANWVQQNKSKRRAAAVACCEDYLGYESEREMACRWVL